MRRNGQRDRYQDSRQGSEGCLECIRESEQGRCNVNTDIIACSTDRISHYLPITVTLLNRMTERRRSGRPSRRPNNRHKRRRKSNRPFPVSSRRSPSPTVASQQLYQLQLRPMEVPRVIIVTLPKLLSKEKVSPFSRHFKKTSLLGTTRADTDTFPFP